jgi:hypothetical protein
MNFCLFHLFGERQDQLRKAVVEYELLSRKKSEEGELKKSNLLNLLRNFFQAVDMLSLFNFHCTKEYLLKKGILGLGEQPNCQQMIMNFMNYGGNIKFNKKWPLIQAEVFSLINRAGAKRKFRRRGIYECAINYLFTGGLDRFWNNHPEFMGREKTDVNFGDEEFLAAKKAA